ncbi:28411_t:CDS:1, partial [Racocetra persica]
ITYIIALPSEKRNIVEELIRLKTQKSLAQYSLTTYRIKGC